MSEGYSVEFAQLSLAFYAGSKPASIVARELAEMVLDGHRPDGLVQFLKDLGPDYGSDAPTFLRLGLVSDADVFGDFTIMAWKRANANAVPWMREAESFRKALALGLPGVPQLLVDGEYCPVDVQLRVVEDAAEVKARVSLACRQNLSREVADALLAQPGGARELLGTMLRRAQFPETQETLVQHALRLLMQSHVPDDVVTGIVLAASRGSLTDSYKRAILSHARENENWVRYNVQQWLEAVISAGFEFELGIKPLKVK